MEMGLKISDRLYAMWKAFRGQPIPFQGLGGGMSSYYTGGLGWPGLFWPNSRIDYQREIGDLRLSTLVMAAARWAGRNLSTARLKVVELDEDNKETEVRDHPLPALFYKPNPYYPGSCLLDGIALSWICDATAYVIKTPSRFGQPLELWFEPYWTCRPRWPQDGSQFISYFEVWRNGTWISIDPENVLVFRDGINPDTRKGQNGTSCLLRELYTDQQASSFAALLLRNGLVPPVVVGLGDKQTPFDGDVKEWKRGLLRSMSGDLAGEPLVTTGPVNVAKLGFEYDKVGLAEIRSIPEERFCAVMGISPYSLHLSASRTRSTFDNVEQYLRYDYKSYITRLHRHIAEVLQQFLLPDFGDSEGLKVDWDYAGVDLMQPDLTGEWNRVALAYRSRILDQAEAREALGYKYDDPHKGVYYPVPSTTVTSSPLTEPEPIDHADGNIDTADEPMKARRRRRAPITDAEQRDAVDWFRDLVPAEAQGLLNARTRNGRHP